MKFSCVLSSQYLPISSHRSINVRSRYRCGHYSSTLLCWRYMQQYLESKFPGSLGGVERFTRELRNDKNVTRKEVSDYLKTQDAYTLHKSVRKPSKYRKTIALGPRDLWQIDLLDFQKFSAENDGYKYLCVIIDVFTKFVWGKPLKNKGGKTIVKSLALLLMTERPKLIQADKGSEFRNKEVSKMLEAFGPRLYHSFSEHKASVVERVQRTLRNRLGRLFTKQNNKVWILEIQNIIDSYNHSYHSTIQMRPADVTKHHSAMILERLSKNSKRRKQKFNKGDRVRIVAKKNTFEKEYTRAWTTEIFIVKSVEQTNPITYKLEDLKGEVIEGGFYSAELQHVA